MRAGQDLTTLTLGFRITCALFFRGWCRVVVGMRRRPTTHRHANVGADCDLDAGADCDFDAGADRYGRAGADCHRKAGAPMPRGGLS